MGVNEKRIAIAKVLFVQGETLKKISEEMDISINILKKLSSKENWRRERENFKQEIFVKLRNAYLEEHLKEKEKALNFLYREREKIIYSMSYKRSSPARRINIIMKIEKAVNELLGLLSPEKIYELELKEMELEKERLKLLDNQV